MKYQLDAADEVQRAQSAREAYRSHLALGVAHQNYSAASDACGLLNSEQPGSYGSFVDHLLFSAEQMLEVEPGWEPTFTEMKAIVIDPLASNTDAHRFYERFGFKFIERRWFDDDSDCFVFRLERQDWE